MCGKAIEKGVSQKTCHCTLLNKSRFGALMIIFKHALRFSEEKPGVATFLLLLCSFAYAKLPFH